MMIELALAITTIAAIVFSGSVIGLHVVWQKKYRAVRVGDTLRVLKNSAHAMRQVGPRHELLKKGDIIVVVSIMDDGHGKLIEYNTGAGWTNHIPLKDLEPA